LYINGGEISCENGVAVRNYGDLYMSGGRVEGKYSIFNEGSVSITGGTRSGMTYGY
jgi:hypothetical protein